MSTKYSVLSTASCLVIAYAGLARAADSKSVYAERLTELATKCDQLGLKEQAAITRGWIIARQPRRQYLFLPAANDATAPKSGAPVQN